MALHYHLHNNFLKIGVNTRGYWVSVGITFSNDMGVNVSKECIGFRSGMSHLCTTFMFHSDKNTQKPFCQYQKSHIYQCLFCCIKKVQNNDEDHLGKHHRAEDDHYDDYDDEGGVETPQKSRTYSNANPTQKAYLFAAPLLGRIGKLDAVVEGKSNSVVRSRAKCNAFG